MTWANLHPHIRTTIEHTLTPKQLHVFKLHLAGCGTRRISDMLTISRSTVRTHLEHTHATLETHGIRRDHTGRYYQEHHP